MQFANIGKSNLIQALGLQRNYKTFSESACAGCKYYGLNMDSLSDESPCKNCPRRNQSFESGKPIYVNEKNKYQINGEIRNSLNCNALKLFMILHTYNPDKYGITSTIDENELAKKLNVHVRTIQNCLQNLQENNYIVYSNAGIGWRFINVQILNYNIQFLPAQYGGRGYVILDSDLLKKLIAIKSVTALRLNIRILLEQDVQRLKDFLSDEAVVTITKTYAELGRYLPKYCKRNIIIKALGMEQDVMEIHINTINAVFVMGDSCNCKKMKQDRLEDCKKDLMEFVRIFNDSIYSCFYEPEAPIDEKIEPLLKNLSQPITFAFHNTELDDMASMCLQYSKETTINAFYEFCQKYLCKEIEYHNLGGLVRTIIEEDLKKELLGKTA